MAATEKWHVTKRKIPASIIYRGKLYKFNKKYHTSAEADSHVAYLEVGRKGVRRPYKGKIAPFKKLATVTKKVLDERGRRWFVVYTREY